MSETAEVGEVVFFTGWRCGCTLISRDHRSTPHCPTHAPGMTTENYSTLAAQTERLAQTDVITITQPGVAIGLEEGA